MPDVLPWLTPVDPMAEKLGLVPIAGRGSNQSDQQQALRQQAANPPTDYAGIVAQASDVLSKIVEPLSLTGMLSQPNRLTNRGFQAILPPEEFRNPLPDIDPNKPVIYPIPHAQGTNAWTGVKNAGADLGNFVQSPVPVLATLFPELRAALAVPEVSGLLATDFAKDIPGQIKSVFNAANNSEAMQGGIGALLNILGVLGGTMHAQGPTKPGPIPKPEDAPPRSSKNPQEGTGQASFTYVVGKENPVKPTHKNVMEDPVIDIEAQVMPPRQLKAPEDLGLVPIRRGEEVAPTEGGNPVYPNRPVDNLRPAVKDVQGKVIVGSKGQTHQDLIKSQPVDWRIENIGQEQHGFTPDEGKTFMDRKQAAEHVGLSEGSELHSQVLIDMQKPPAPTDPEFRHTMAGLVNRIAYGVEKGKFNPEQGQEYTARMRDLASRASRGEHTLPDLEKLDQEVLGKTKTEIKGKLYSGVPGLDPGEKSPKDLWDKGALFTTQAVKLLSEAAGGERSTKEITGFLRNKLGEKSAEWEALKGAGIEKALGEKATPKEVAKWINENGPKVKVMKMGEGAATPEQQRYYSLTHSFYDQLGTRFQGLVNSYYDRGFNPKQFREVIERDEKGTGLHSDEDIEKFIGQAGEYMEARRAAEAQGRAPDISHWSSIAPKSEQDMPGYVEIAVVKPLTKNPNSDDPKWGKNVRPEYLDPQFQSSHNFPPNTLGFLRGYMEEKNGEKIFHVIEVQSDWEAQYREGMEHALEMARQQREPSNFFPSNDPLLSSYERLALKAAIEHARTEGATKIAISDAETAMMTEGHDRAAHGQFDQPQQRPDGSIYYPKQIDQEQGMRLHYDRTLPKIAEELTGVKGERTEFGEHKNAMASGRLTAAPGLGGGGLEPGSPRSDLIFRNPDGTPKTSVTARSFDIKRPAERRATGEPFSTSGKMYVTLPGLPELAEWIEGKVKELWDKGGGLKELVDPEYLKGIAAGFQKYDAPAHMVRDKELANDLVSYASAQAAAHATARSMATDVLGSHYKDAAFGRDVAIAIYEDMRRASADPITGAVPGKQYWNDQQFVQKLLDPEIQEAIKRHMQLVQPLSEKLHTDLGGKLAEPGQWTKAFINLIPLNKDFKGAGGSGPMSTLKKGSAHSLHRTFGAEDYNMDYYDVVQHMLERNYVETAKQKLYDTYDRTGQGKFLEAGDDVPPGMVPKQIQRRIVVASKDKKTTIINQNERLAIKKALEPEFDRAMDLHRIHVPKMLEAYCKTLVKVQLATGIDAGFHTGNMFGAVNGAQRAGGLESMFGPREISTVTRIVKNVSKVLNDSPEVRREIMKLAESSVVRDLGGNKSLGPKDFIPFVGKPAHNIIHLADTAGRLALSKMFDELVKAGEVKDLPEERRRYVNQMLQYNPRLMSELDLTLRDLGVSTFINAGKGFNRLAMNRLSLSPMTKAASPAQAARMRLNNALGLITTLIVAPAILNTLMTGKPTGREGTRYGEIDLGPKWDTKDHKRRTVDLLKYLMLRRATRITGLQALADGHEKGLSMGTISKNAGRDAFEGFIGPYYGPVARFTKELFEPVAQGKGPGWLKAGIEANPMLGAMLRGKESGTKEETLGERALSIGGVMTSQSDRSRLKEMARDVAASYGKEPPGGLVSDYADMVKAIEFGKYDVAKKLYADLIQKKNKGYEKEEPGDDGLSHGEKTVQKYFHNLPTHPYTGSATFEADLILKNPKLYMKVRNQDADVMNRFFEHVLGEPVPEPSENRKQTPMSKALDDLGFQPQ